MLPCASCLQLENQKEAFEQELQQQLRRQVAAHTEHLKEALEDQRHDLDRAFGQAIERKIIEERSRHNAALAASVAKLQGMEGYLKGEYSAFFVWTCAVCCVTGVRLVSRAMAVF